MGRPPKPAPQRRPNPLTSLKPIRNPTPVLVRAMQGAAKARRLCPNKQCTNPKIEDGTCVNCGTIVDDANIVAEVQFGENSSGAAVVQGSFVSADQGAAKSLGPAFRRAGGSEDREKTMREGKRLMAGYAWEHKLSDSAVNAGMQIFKLATLHNFIQGRRMNMVAAVCMYTACRKERPCRVMLIDFADSCQVNVFKLGHCFKALHKQITISKDGVQPILAEDLIYRFAQKLEFGSETEKVALAAVRLVNRMSKDWMVMGRRPSGICGACLILAARMHNFRRTVTEVVYVVKVTTATLQKRLEEFQFTPSSNMTVEAFLGNDFLESSHDPPSFYKNTEAYLSTKKTRKRKRTYGQEEEEHDENEVEAEGSGAAQAGTEAGGQNLAASNSSGAPSASDALMLPPPPRNPPTGNTNDLPHTGAIAGESASSFALDPALLEDTDDPVALANLVAQHGDVPVGEPGSPADTAEREASKEKGGRGRPPASTAVDVDWENDEADLETQISEMISDPNTLEHTKAFATAEQRARVHAMIAYASGPQREIPMGEVIEEGEFANDPEVTNCLLSEAEAKIKECIWVNANKDWLRDQQQKEFKRKMDAMGPPKATRNRTKKKKIGEGQTSAANSPAEAATAVLKERAFSKRINYEAIAGMFSGGGGGMLGSAATSRVTSRATSMAPSSTAAPSTAGSVAGDSVDDGASVAASDAGMDAMSDMGDEDHYEDEDDVGLDPDADWKKDFEDGGDDE